MDLRRVFNSITYEIKELLHRVRIDTLDKENRRFTVEFDGSNSTEHIEIITKYWDSYGRCYSIRPRHHVLKLGVTGIEIVGRVEIWVHFGYPGQFMYNTKTKVIINYW